MPAFRQRGQLPAALLSAALLATGCGQRPAASTASTPEAPAAASVPAPDPADRIGRWRQQGYGMFVHWGLYSELGGEWNGKPVTRGYSEQIQGWANISRDDYARVARGFAAPKFDADAICGLARDAGARYVVVTSKHHDGFAMFDTASTDYDIVDRTPFGKDPIKLIAAACRARGLGLGIYFSLVDWHAGHPFDPDNGNPIPASMEPLIEQQVTELMTNYGPITEVWFDMSTPTPEQSRRFAGIVHRLQPAAVINGRIWNNAGDFVTLGDNEAPPPTMQPPFEVPASIYHATWGYRRWQQRDDAPGKVRELVNGLVQARAAGGNYLLNIGPMGDGAVVPFEAEVLRGIGQWLQRHANVALDARPSGLPPQAWGSTLADDRALYLFVRDWRGGPLAVEGVAGNPRAVRIDGDEGATPLAWRREGDTLVIDLPARAPDAVLPVLRVETQGPLRIVPPDAVTVAASGTATLPRAAWHPGTSFAFGSGYRSQYATTVSLRASLLPERAQAAAWLRFSGVKAAAGQRYRIRVGAQEQVVTADMLGAQAIGPFALPDAATGATPVTITLATPDHPAQDLRLRFDAARVLPRADASP